MAEFLDVMRQAKRMCVTVNDCDQCELMTDAGCRFAIFGDDAKYSIEIERIVMNWTAKNPEPRYPSWNEWQKQIAPEATNPINACTFMSRMEKEKAYGFSACAVSCAECGNRPIPADIAEKLGIKPVGGSDNG